LQAARQRESTTNDFGETYALRAGIEGTLARGIRLSWLVWLIRALAIVG